MSAVSVWHIKAIIAVDGCRSSALYVNMPVYASVYCQETPISRSEMSKLDYTSTGLFCLGQNKKGKAMSWVLYIAVEMDCIHKSRHPSMQYSWHLAWSSHPV